MIDSFWNFLYMLTWDQVWGRSPGWGWWCRRGRCRSSRSSGPKPRSRNTWSSRRTGQAAPGLTMLFIIHTAIYRPSSTPSPTSSLAQFLNQVEIHAVVDALVRRISANYAVYSTLLSINYPTPPPTFFLAQVLNHEVEIHGIVYILVKRLKF